MSHRPPLPACLALVLLAALAAAPAAPRPGTVKGRLVWPDKVPLPENPEVNLVRDREYCLSKGKIHRDELIVHPKSRGIGNAIFWLADAKDHLKPLRVAHTAKGPAKTVEIDAPCCTFVPRIVAAVAGQQLVLKNSSAVARNVKVTSPVSEPTVNVLLRPGGKYDVTDPLTARLMPALIDSSVHPWMRAYLFVLPGPYFAVTDADGAFTIKDVPRGRYRLIGWQESIGWVWRRPKPGELPGRLIEVKEGTTLDVGTTERQPERE